jgi:hypothetical protein
MSCELCKRDFLTEADPHVIRPTSKGYLHYCSCIIINHDQISGIEKLQAENKKLREALEFYATHARDNCHYPVTDKIAREALKEVGEE